MVVIDPVKITALLALGAVISALASTAGYFFASCVVQLIEIFKEI